LQIRREHGRSKSIKALMRETGLSRNTIRKAIGRRAHSFRIGGAQPRRARVRRTARRISGSQRARREAGSARLSRIHDLLQRDGFGGSYDAVRRYAARWKRERRGGALVDPGQLYIPLSFAPEAYQFDWSHEDFEIAGKPMRVKVAHAAVLVAHDISADLPTRDAGDGVRRPCPGFEFFGGCRGADLRQSMDASRRKVVLIVASGLGCVIYPACGRSGHAPGLDGSPLLLAS
jgi:hypothetical protein